MSSVDLSGSWKSDFNLQLWIIFLFAVFQDTYSMTHLIIYLFMPCMFEITNVWRERGKSVFNTFHLELAPIEMQRDVVLVLEIIRLFWFLSNEQSTGFHGI